MGQPRRDDLSGVQIRKRGLFVSQRLAKAGCRRPATAFRKRGAFSRHHGHNCRCPNPKISILIYTMSAFQRPVIYGGEKIIPQVRIDRVKEDYGLLEKFLQGKKWVAGDHVTVADFSIVSSITTMDVVVSIQGAQFPNIAAWIERMEKLPYYDQNKTGLDQIRKVIEDNLK